MSMLLRRYRDKPDKDEPVDEKTFSDPPADRKADQKADEPVDEKPEKKTAEKG